MEIPHGNTTWKYHMEIPHGNTTWKYHMEIPHKAADTIY
ncbi:MAG: hypothetical protein HMLIMOIP_000255 [Candidatus Nitrosomirales archaeon]|jgi:hypothetical protein